jgi:DNA-binding SARP family transcriptional activator
MAGAVADTGVRFRVLGSLEIASEGHAATITGVRQRSLLTYLLLHANRPVTTDELLERLWGEKAPPTAAASLRVAVSKVRRFLEDEAAGAATLQTVPGGYVLGVEPDAIDAHLFERLAKEGAEALRRGDVAAARQRLSEALALWTEEPFGDLGYEQFLLAEKPRLDERRMSALEDRVEADLRSGRDAELVAELRALVAKEPFRERLRGQLMLALYRSGRQPEALRVYRDGRDLLDAELGLTPGPELRRLERQILTQDPALGAPAARPGARAAEQPVDSVRRLRRFVVAAASVLAVAAIVAFLVVARSSGGVAVSAIPANSVASIDPDTGRATRVIRAGTTPHALGVTANVLWVANFGDGTLSRIDLRRGASSAVAVTTAATADIAVGAGGIWVADRADGQLVRVDPSSGQPLVRIQLSPGISDVAVGYGAVWVSNESAGTVAKVDPHSSAVVATVRLDGPVGLAVGSGRVWAAESFARDLAAIDPATDAVAAHIPLSVAPEDVAYAANTLWATHPLDSLVSRVDLPSQRIQLIPVGRQPTDIAADTRSAWVINDLDHSVFQIDARTGTVKRRLVLSDPATESSHPTTPGGLALRGGRLWMSVQRY